MSWTFWRVKCCRLSLRTEVSFWATTRWLKITEKVSFNIASEASYFCFLVHKSSLKMPDNGPSWWLLESEACNQIVVPDRSLFNTTKIGGKYPKSKIQMWHFKEFSDIVIAFYFVLKPEVSLWLPHLQLESWKSRCYLMVPP